MIDAGTLTRRPPGEAVFKQGDVGTSLRRDVKDALGRGLEYYDMPLVRSIVRTVETTRGSSAGRKPTSGISRWRL